MRSRCAGGCGDEVTGKGGNTLRASGGQVGERDWKDAEGT